MTNFFEDILKSSKRNPSLIETEKRSEFVKKLFENLLNNNNITRYPLTASSGAVLAERFNRSIETFLKNAVFERCDAKWVDVLSTITKQKNDRINSFTKLKAIQISFKNE